MAPNPAVDPQQLRDAATARAQGLLRDRLRRGGVSTSRPDWFFQCAADAPEPFPGGTQVRVRTWRHWSNAQVQFDADTGEVLHRRIDRLADPPAQVELSQAEAVAVATAAGVVPPDARLTAFRHESFAPGRNVARLEWDHVHEELRVAGDCLQVVIHPQSRRIVELTRRWRKLVTSGRPSG
jgi:hypothetical protein